MTTAALLHSGSASPAGAALGPSLRRLAGSTAGYAEAKRHSWADQLKGLEETSGAVDRAVIEGLKAWAKGANPVTAALRGAWAGADAKTRVAIVSVLLLTVVLAPVLVLVILLVLLVAAIVRAVRSAAASA